MVRSRARLVTLTQAVLSRDGFRVPTGSSGCFGDRVGRQGLKLPELRAEIASLLAALPSLNEQRTVITGTGEGLQYFGSLPTLDPTGWISRGPNG